jgi:hypothetical protein
MLILLNIEKQEINIYNKEGITTLPFSQAQNLYSYLDDTIIYYVTQAIEVNIQDIFTTLNQIGVSIDESIEPDSSNRYIHTTQTGTLYIDDTLKFNGKFDCRSYTPELEKIIQFNPTAQKLIQKKQLEIINESRKNSLMREFKESINKLEKKQKKVDEKLDKMILDTKVADFDPEESKDDIISIDITDDVKSGRRETEEEKLMNEIIRK